MFIRNVGRLLKRVVVATRSSYATKIKILVIVFWFHQCSATNYSTITREFGRFFSGSSPAQDTVTRSWAERQEECTTLLKMFTNDADKLPADQQAAATSATLSLRTCMDLKLLCGDEKQEHAALLFYLPQPKLTTGLIMLADMLTKPCMQHEQLAKRAGLIEVLKQDQELVTRLTGIVDAAGEAMSSLAQLLNANPYKDSTSLLNGNFGLFWETKSFTGLIPKKIRKKVKGLLSKTDRSSNPEPKTEKKIKRKIGKANFLVRWIDKSSLLLNLTLGATAFFASMSWLTQVGAWSKDVGEIYNFSWADRVKKFFKTSRVSYEQLAKCEKYVNEHDLLNKIKTNDLRLEDKTLTDEEKTNIFGLLNNLLALSDDIKTTKEAFPGLSPNNLYRWLMTPKWRQQLAQDIQLVQQALYLKPIGKDAEVQDQYNFDPKVFINVTKLFNRVLKPSYTCIAPYLIISGILRDLKSFKVAKARAKREIMDMAQLLTACDEYLKILDTFAQQNPEKQIYLTQFLTIDALRKFNATKNAELRSLLGTLREMPTINPGKFLATYKLLHHKIADFAPMIKALGELDAYLALVQMAGNEHYTFAQYLPSDAPQVLKITNFWDPKIGASECISNSIELSSNMRGMVITGSNAAGKSSYMRSVLQAAIMGQTICLVPADSAQLTPFGSFFTLIGKADDPASGRSLYRVEAEEVANFIQLANSAQPQRPLLACIDEMFSSTGPDAACALTRAVLADVAKSTATFVLIASHSPGISKIEADTNGIFKNFKVSVIRGASGEFIGYNRKIVPGFALPEDLTAFDVAQMAGISENIILQAKAYKT